MSLIAKLWAAGRQQSAVVGEQRLPSHHGNSVDLGSERVRILLVRECESRGRTLLFDSVAVERNRQRCAEKNEKIDNNNSSPSACRNAMANGRPKNSNVACEVKFNDRSLSKQNEELSVRIGQLDFDNDCVFEFFDRSEQESVTYKHDKLLNDDISLLSEMIFGSVAMTYSGASFKIHALNSPKSLMCTKVFPYSEHSVCKQSQRHSSETLGASSTFDSHSSNSSLRSQHSRLSSGNTSGNSLCPNLRKNSTCSSTGSGWDLDIPYLGSSHSLDGSSTGGSLSSLRRRWQRALRTSLSRSESEEAFGQSGEGSPDSVEPPTALKHKTRLGLAILLQLPAGQEQEVSSRLMEHAAVLESVLDRLRYSCAESPGVERSLVARLYRASSSGGLRLLQFLMAPVLERPAPLLWHDLLLGSRPADSVSTLKHSLNQMCLLLEALDTKSTNFFMSTIVTAVLTHHLGWVHTAPPLRNSHMMEILHRQYPCNPLWMQLNELYGSLGSPSRVSQTVIAGEPEKAHLIEAILVFLSYFLRSGLAVRRYEKRCSKQEDVEEAVAALERVRHKNPALFEPQPVPCSSSGTSGCAATCKRTARAATRRASKSREEEASNSLEERPKLPLQEPTVKPEMLAFAEEATAKRLKRSSTLHKSLNELANGEEKGWTEASSKVKIIVSDESERVKFCKDDALRLLPEGCDKDRVEQTDNSLRRQKLAGFEGLESNSKSFERPSWLFPSTLYEEAAWQSKTQVYFTLGDEERPSMSIRERLQSGCKCQCAYTFTRMPSTSAELPEGVLRKILQRNFPESSKNMPTVNGESVCLKCRQGYGAASQGKLLLETPTNATEVLRGCATSTASSSSTATVTRSDSLESLMEASCVVELPMPRSNSTPQRRKSPTDRAGFTNSLVNTKPVELTDTNSGYTWGMVMQGLTKTKRKDRRKTTSASSSPSGSPSKPPNGTGQKSANQEEWWKPIRDGLGLEAKFPLVDQPISEALCIVGDIDTWQVGLLSNTTAGTVPTPVGMSRLVANMLEAFAFVWKQFHSPEQCITLLENRLTEMWLRSETLAEFLLAADLDDASIGNLTNFLDVDAADLPLLLAIATTHTPQIAHRFGLTIA